MKKVRNPPFDTGSQTNVIGIGPACGPVSGVASCAPSVLPNETLVPIYNRDLEIKPSRVKGAGLGLFTKVDLCARTFVDVYSGIKVSQDEYEEKFLRNRYALDDERNDQVIIADATDSCYARYANDVEIQGLPCNASFEDFKFEVEKKKHAHMPDWFANETMCLVTTAFIRAGEEIYVSYGRRYWAGNPAVSQCHNEKLRYQSFLRKIKKALVIQETREKRQKQQEANGHLNSRHFIFVWMDTSDTMQLERPQLVKARWSKTTKHALPYHENGILDYNEKKRLWLILVKDGTKSYKNNVGKCLFRKPKRFFF